MSPLLLLLLSFCKTLNTKKFLAEALKKRENIQIDNKKLLADLWLCSVLSRHAQLVFLNESTDSNIHQILRFRLFSDSSSYSK